MFSTSPGTRSYSEGLRTGNGENADDGTATLALLGWGLLVVTLDDARDGADLLPSLGVRDVVRLVRRGVRIGEDGVAGAVLGVVLVQARQRETMLESGGFECGVVDPLGRGTRSHRTRRLGGVLSCGGQIGR